MAPGAILLGEEAGHLMRTIESRWPDMSPKVRTTFANILRWPVAFARIVTSEIGDLATFFLDRRRSGIPGVQLYVRRVYRTPL